MLGLLLALPLGALAHRYRWSYATLITLAGLLYTIPSLALFVVLPGILGTRILNPLNVVVALTLYTLALLVRVVADALDSVPPLVRRARRRWATARCARLITVQLPLAIPVIGAGLRVAAVSNVSLVSVAALLGIPQLGQLFTVGFQLDFYTPIIAGIVLCLLVAGALRHDHPGRGAARHPMDQGGEGPMIGALGLADHRGQLVGTRRRARPASSSTSGTRSWRWASHWSSRCRSARLIGHTGRLTGLGIRAGECAAGACPRWVC